MGLLTSWPGAFWLAVPVLAALVLFRLYRTRRKELVTGSLLLWRRLAAQQPKARPKRVLVDSSLALQAAAMLALIAALAGPGLTMTDISGRGLVLVLDNAPPARTRTTAGTPAWQRVQEQAQAILRELRPRDTVFLARTSPQPKLLVAAGRPAEAARAVAEQQPALSGPAAEQSWLFALDIARRPAKSRALRAVVVSLREEPAAAGAVGPAFLSAASWLTVVPSSPALANAGIVDFGALPVARDGQAEAQVLVRLRNYAAQAVQGTVRCEVLGGTDDAAPQAQPCVLGAQGEEAVVFSVPREPARALRLAWSRDDGAADGLPEDDVIVAAPRQVGAPRVRLHAPVPALARLYRVALNAVFVLPDDAGGADLEVYCGSVPERVAESSRGVMLLAPEAGYRLVFDVSGKTLVWPKLQRDESDPLTKGIVDRPEGVFAVPQACEILATGDFKPLLKDAATGRAMAARFTDEKQRFGLVLAFVPGAGFPPERMLEPELAAVLVRAAAEAAGMGELFKVARAETLELQSGEPLALDWHPSPAAQSGAGVLDEAASGAALVRNRMELAHDFRLDPLQLLSREHVVDLRAWLMLVALVLAGLELWVEQRARRA